MNTFFKRSILALVLAATASTAALARDHRHEPKQAPEVDPNLAIGGVTLLAGALTVLRARRSK